MDTLLKDADLVKLAGLPGLKRLRVGLAQFSPAALQQFTTQRPGCQVQLLSADQTAARTCLALGGSVQVRGNNKALRIVQGLDDLPETEEVRVVEFKLRHMTIFPHWHFRCLRNLSELRLFGSWYNGIDDACVRHWHDLPRLETVNFGTSRLTAAGLEHLSGFPAISHLNLNLSTCDDAGVVQLAKLPRLESLWLWQTAVTDAAVEPLSKMKQLRELDLRETKLTPDGVARLRKALPGCKIAYP